MLLLRLCKLCIYLMLMLGSQLAIAGTLEEVRERGYLLCGVTQSLPGFSYFNDNGTWSGFDVDICRAVAAAVLPDAPKVRYVPLSSKDRFTALQTGEIDILSRNTTWTFTRDVALGFDFTNIVYYDGQGFMVRKNSGITSALQLHDAVICTNSGTTTELNASDFFRKNNMNYKIISFEKNSEVIAAYDTGRCDAYTSDLSGLAAQRLRLLNPDDNIILPEVISKEPLGPLVRQDDNRWADIVRWVVFGLVNAEEMGISSANVRDMEQSDDPNVKRLLGSGVNLGKFFNLPANFMVSVIQEVGNYGEIFERNLGQQSHLKLPRGLNNLWNNGGIMYVPDFR